ncbi:hypothetical protein BB561_003340 [Smittium simulii]|uniref:Coatomer subunit beta n=1 Tax=Smittium simulii TaxID=133385 RepID=A0A2T9YM01_9FUNG|nr:hypothetical protein BB561_003340 [Smittium simulii]
MSQDICYSLIEQKADLDVPNLQTLKRDLERGTSSIKQEALQKIIIGSLNGEKYDSLLMHVIRFVMPTKDKDLKKMLLFYWEVCPKYDEDGKLKHETILICNSLLNDLHHSNEYIRGATLRFLCRIKDVELLEPLVGPIRDCLEHRHAYVRRNAVLAISSIYKKFSHLFPDAPELMISFMSSEPDSTCKRNALVMLTSSSIDLAVNWLLESLNVIESSESIIQLAVIDLIRKSIKQYPMHKPKFIACLFELLSSSSSSVKFEAAVTLVSLTSNSVAIKAAGMALIQLVIKESDNNVKLIVLENLDDLRIRQEGLLHDLVVDLLRILPNSGLEVKRRCLGIVMNLTTQRNINDVIDILKKELKKTLETDAEKDLKYRGLLVQTIHSCAVSFPEVATDITKLFLGAISEFSTSSAADAIAFVKEVVEKFPSLRAYIIKELLIMFTDIKTNDAMCKALWILGEYSDDISTVTMSWEKIQDSIGELPLLAKEERENFELQDDNPSSLNDTELTYQNTTKILPDGTYATESALVSSHSANKNLANNPPLRALLLSGNYYLGTVLANTLVKLVLRFAELKAPEQEFNKFNAQALLVMIGVIRIGQSKFVSFSIDNDSYDRILACIRALEHREEDMSELEAIFLTESHSAFSRIIKQKDVRQESSKNKNKNEAADSFNSPMEFRLLESKSDEYDFDCDIESGAADPSSTIQVVTKLDSIVQLTGFSDPIYVEAYMTVHQYDIVLDILVVNQTNDTLKNVTIDFTLMSDLKLVEKPRPYNISPRSFSSVKAVIKVSSAETGIIFGTLSYNGPGVGETRCIEFNDINIDILEYIRPSYCDDSKFYSMWSEFEWENKINVNTKMTDLHEYITCLLESTNMACLTPDSALSGDCGFLAANLYAKSIFGEDALMNVSLEKVDDDSYVTGHIRIRSKSQGIALSLGDKVTIMQSKLPDTKRKHIVEQESSEIPISV